MIPLSDADRKVLKASLIDIDFGCDVIDDAGTVLRTLSPEWIADPNDPTRRVVAGTSDILGGTVQHNANADVHRECQLRITVELDWEHIWLRPWQSVSSGGHTLKVNQGVFRPVTPQAPMGQEPRVWTVRGVDRLSMMQDAIGDTVTSAKDALLSDEIRATITAAQVPGDIIGSTSVGAVTLPRVMVWMLDLGQPTTHLQRANDLLAAGGAQPLFMDGEGRFRLALHQPLAQRAADWTFDADDATSGILAVERSAEMSTWARTNWWRFTVRDRTARPVEGVSQYTVDRSGGGRKVRAFVETDAVDYASLVAVGDQRVEADTARTLTIRISVRGFPVTEHRDVFDYRDMQLRAGALQHTVCTGWLLTLETGDNAITVEVPDA